MGNMMGKSLKNEDAEKKLGVSASGNITVWVGANVYYIPPGTTFADAEAAIQSKENAAGSLRLSGAPDKDIDDKTTEIQQANKLIFYPMGPGSFDSLLSCVTGPCSGLAESPATDPATAPATAQASS
jgi:hypothetical protein